MNIELKTTEDVRTILKMHVIPAAVAAALELHLFWRLDEEPLNANTVSQKLGIPLDRCHYWLELLLELGLLERKNNTYTPSSLTQSTIIDTYSPESWSFIAQESQAQYPSGNNLASHITHPKSVWTSQGKRPSDWFKQMKEDPEYARRFTYTLYEVHYSVGEKLAEKLDLTSVKRLMDLGGGSGVISLALLKQHPDLTAVVIDIPNVCVIGREIADETSVADRIEYQVADYDQDDLPTGFDMIMNCDAGGFNRELLHKLFKALNDGGQLIIVSNIEIDSGWLETYPRQQLSFSMLLKFFQSSLGVPKLSHMTITESINRLTETGFHPVIEETLEDGTLIFRAQKPLLS